MICFTISRSHLIRILMFRFIRELDPVAVFFNHTGEEVHALIEIHFLFSIHDSYLPPRFFDKVSRSRLA